MRHLFEAGVYSSNYSNGQLKSLLHLGQIVITFRTLLHLRQNVIAFRTLLHLGPFITFRPPTMSVKSSNLSTDFVISFRISQITPKRQKRRVLTWCHVTCIVI